MRADRLLSLIMLLQARGQMTACKLAKELEVSERTIYRDLDVLSTAGIPVYAERGFGGGIGLLDDYRTTLTGLTSGEIRSLALIQVPEPLSALGVGRDLKQALLKLYASLSLRQIDGESIRQYILLDWGWWGQSHVQSPYLQLIYQAVRDDRCIHIVYHMLNHILIENNVDPYGLVAKAGEWYLVFAADRQVRHIRVAILEDVRLVGAVLRGRWISIWRRGGQTGAVMLKIADSGSKHCCG